MVAAALLDKRITLQQPTPTRNALGEPAIAWTDFATVWAGVQPIQGREFWAQQQVQSDVTVRVRMRFLRGVNSAMRIKYGDRVLNIISVIDPNERHAELQLMCSEGANNG